MPEHPLFQRYPLTGTRRISAGEVTVPYQIYDGYGVFIGGTIDLQRARELLQPEAVRPVADASGRALAGIWVCDFTEASLGAHTELQFSIFVSKVEIVPLAADPLNPLLVMLNRPELGMLCHGLWNNTRTVVAYNRELLGLNARLSSSTLARDARNFNFEIQDTVSGEVVINGALSQPFRTSARANWMLTRALGLKRLLEIGQQPWVGMRVVNPVGAGLDENRAARAYNHSDRTSLHLFSPADRLEICAEPYRSLDFQPGFIQGMQGFKFVYLMPEAF